MPLSQFLNGLFSDGQVTVARALGDFDESDLDGSARLIAEFEMKEQLEMPAGLPVFNQDAALWAAQYLYRSIQFVLLRDLDAEAMQAYLKPYAGPANAAAIWSVDIIFRHFGPLFKFSSGISPDDPLVQKLRETAATWPMSSVGLNIQTSADTTAIMKNPALKTIYLDRIIGCRDLTRLRDAEQNILAETTGLYQQQFWPDLDLIELTKHD